MATQEELECHVSQSGVSFCVLYKNKVRVIRRKSTIKPVKYIDTKSL